MKKIIGLILLCTVLFIVFTYSSTDHFVILEPHATTTTSGTDVLVVQIPPPVVKKIVSKESLPVKKVDPPATIEKVEIVPEPVPEPLPLPEPPARIYTTEEILQEWSPETVFLKCYTANPQYYFYTGSGIAYSLQNSEIEILSAKHILKTDNGEPIEYCKITFVNIPAKPEFIVGRGEFIMIEKHDAFKIHFDDISSKVINYVPARFPPICEDVDVGENVLVLGYPFSKNSIFSYVTGKTEKWKYSPPWYLISAYVEHGYSGGPVISLKNDCMLGIINNSDFEKLSTVLDANLLK